MIIIKIYKCNELDIIYILTLFFLNFIFNRSKHKYGIANLKNAKVKITN